LPITHCFRQVYGFSIKALKIGQEMLVMVFNVIHQYANQ